MNVPPPVPWDVVLPGEQRHRVVVHTVEQAVQLVAGHLGRSVRLVPRFIGERGEVWRVGVADHPARPLAPTVYEGA
jgi:hypothetical protein